jgi:hypothetical protein
MGTDVDLEGVEEDLSVIFKTRVALIRPEK